MRIVCFGDSLTCCGGRGGTFPDILQERFPHHRFSNRGVDGETLQDARARLAADVLSSPPDIVLLEFGANDWWQDKRLYTEWAEDLECLVEDIHAAGSIVVILGVFGSLVTAAGARVRKTGSTDERGMCFSALEGSIAIKHNCPYIPNIQERVIGDRLCWENVNHPNEYGNRYIADTIEPILVDLFNQAARPVRKPNLRTTRDTWREAVEFAPEHLAVVDGARRLTYAQADAQIETLAAGLLAAANTDHPKVAIHLPNCLEYYLLYWAIVRLGGVVIPLNLWLMEESLAGIFKTTYPDVLILRSAADKKVLRAADARPPRRIFCLTGEGEGLHPYADLLTETKPAPLRGIAPDAVSIIMHTSGTTATPKGAVMRHVDLRFNSVAAINAHGFCAADVHLLINPMFHCTALYSSLPVAALQKSVIVITAETSPEKLLRLVAKEKVTTFLSVPSVFQRILTLKNLATYDTSSLRVIAYAGSPMPVRTIEQLREAFPDVRLHNFFGLTETIAMTHVLRGEDALARPDSIGTLLPFVEAMIVDEDDAVVPPGEVGELLFARDIVISEYYKQPDRLAEAICTIDEREWFRTGDLAAVDEQGFFCIKGRKKDMVIVGGENVFAAEVEAVLLTHPAISEAAIKGVPATGVRKFLGELIHAYVVVNEGMLTEAEVRKFCVKRLAGYKVPHFVTFLAALPRNPVGKVVKAELTTAAQTASS